MVTDDLRALDAEVHRKVMGGSVDYPATDTSLAYTVVSPAPRYSTDIAAAWRVVEKLASHNHRLTLEDWRDSKHAGWSALVTLSNGHDTGDVIAETMPLAICRAALKAIETQPVTEVS